MSCAVVEAHHGLITQQSMRGRRVASSENNPCSDESWSASQSFCKENKFIKGFKRKKYFYYDSLDHLEGFQCCRATSQWNTYPVHVVYTDWNSIMESYNTWAYCPEGFFLQGLHSSGSGWIWNAYLNNIENARCVKPSIHPYSYDHCYEKDISFSFDNAGTCSCDGENYYVSGLKKGDTNYLHDIQLLYCCSMAKGPQEINNPEMFKTRVMDTTFYPLVFLAKKLGYAWTLGCRGHSTSDDFEKNGEKWQASTKAFKSKKCDGDKWYERLNIVYSDWNLDVQQIKYGEKVEDYLILENIDGGEIYNNASTDVTESFELSQTIQESVTHSSTTSWTSSIQMGIKLKFKMTGTGGETSLTFRLDSTSSTTNVKSLQNVTTLKRKTSKTLKPFTSARYRVKLTKKRITIPYTAVVICNFSAELKGFLVDQKNYHFQFTKTNAQPTFSYRFGNESIPFFKELNRQSMSKSLPWL
ncbi:hypothetical protein Btru_039726 [Bulinus truncatus]|nr:hypothetical protein Btru_039726 [Bulinus truncatus]